MGMSRPSGVISSTQHFMSWRTLRVYGSWLRMISG
jgi:hypothetical protein